MLSGKKGLNAVNKGTVSEADLEGGVRPPKIRKAYMLYNVH